MGIFIEKKLPAILCAALVMASPLGAQVKSSGDVEVKPEASLRHQVMVNQLAFNNGWPKRFTVPTGVNDEIGFEVRDARSKQVVFKGNVENGVGDFSAWESATDGSYLIHVRDRESKEGESFPFIVGARAIQKSLLQPMVDFMIDARSVVGTHPSAYGGAAWRDGTYYTHELASLVTLYLAFPEEIGEMPRQIDWSAERTKVMDPGFKIVPARMDRGMMEAVGIYYTKVPPPSPEAPDVVKLIHWGAGLTLVKPELMDPSGDGNGYQVHSQLVEQLAYVLAIRPRLEKWIPKTFFDLVGRFVEQHWASCGLLSIPPSWNPASYREPDDPLIAKGHGADVNPYKGRHVPGHSVLPNLLMYEVARRDGLSRADRYLSAAVSQAEYVVREMDWNDPRHTKGHRMSEHKMITGLVWLQQNYPDHAPEGLKRKLEQWADIAISRSDNMWDFRRYDLGSHWSVPIMNEPGNLAGFPACALGVSWLIDDPVKRSRLREISIGALDCLFGRNPVNAASPHHPELGWNGLLESGWSVGFKRGVTARLELCRGSLTSSPSSEMYPFEPRGKFRHAEGWSAFNAALNVGLAYLERDAGRAAFLPKDCIKQDPE